MSVTEAKVIAHIEHELDRARRYFLNIHGSMFSKNGSADFMTLDSDGVLTAIEAKAPGAQPYVNQWRNAIDVVKSGGRFIVAYDDFTVEDMDAHELKFFRIGSEIGLSEFEAELEDRTHSVEVILI